jgi:hypothetical protein
MRIGPERYGIGGTMWDYSGSFAVVTKMEGHTVPMSLPSKPWAYNHCPCEMNYQSSVSFCRGQRRKNSCRAIATAQVHERSRPWHPKQFHA